MRYAKLHLPLLLGIGTIGFAGPTAYLVKRNAPPAMEPVSSVVPYVMVDNANGNTARQGDRWHTYANIPSWPNNFDRPDNPSKRKWLRFHLEPSTYDGGDFRSWVHEGEIPRLDFMNGRLRIRGLTDPGQTSGLERIPELIAVVLTEESTALKRTAYQEKVLTHLRNCLQVPEQAEPKIDISWKAAATKNYGIYLQPNAANNKPAEVIDNEEQPLTVHDTAEEGLRLLGQLIVAMGCNASENAERLREYHAYGEDAEGYYTIPEYYRPFFETINWYDRIDSRSKQEIVWQEQQQKPFTPEQREILVKLIRKAMDNVAEDLTQELK